MRCRENGASPYARFVVRLFLVSFSMFHFAYLATTLLFLHEMYRFGRVYVCG